MFTSSGLASNKCYMLRGLEAFQLKYFLIPEFSHLLKFNLYLKSSKSTYLTTCSKVIQSRKK